MGDSKKGEGKGETKTNPIKTESPRKNKGGNDGEAQSDEVFPLLSVLPIAVGNEPRSHSMAQGK